MHLQQEEGQRPTMIANIDREKSMKGGILPVIKIETKAK